MLLDWLKDLIAIVEAGTYAAASKTRHVTQPALSRRIQALEEWVGVPLFVRTPSGVTLSEAGKSFLPAARETLSRLEVARGAAQAAAFQQPGVVRFCATNALTFSFFPQWISSLEAQVPGLQVQFTTNHLEACERMLVRDEVDFLLAHRPAGQAGPLDPVQYLQKVLDLDVLMPVSKPSRSKSKQPLHRLPGAPGRPAAYLSYTPQAGLGRVVDSIGVLLESRAHLRSVFATHASSVVAAMALQGRGIGWLPASLIRAQLDRGELVRAGTQLWDVPMEICLQRKAALLPPGAEILWSTAVGR
jgi:DNA-binding transcriptional LysR family regulator